MDDDASQCMLRESDVGITEFIEPDLRISGIIKHRFTDFLVNEIDQNGEVVHLRNLRVQSAPQAAPPPQPKKPEQAPNEWPEDADEKLKEIWSEAKIEELKAYVQRGRVWGRRDKDAADASKAVVSDAITSKDERKRFHEIVREVFGGRLMTEHRDIDGSAHVEINWGTAANRYRTPRADKPEPDCQFIHFTLQKMNRETHDALGSLAKVFGCKASDLGIQGTKDKRGVTVQRVSLWRGRNTLESVQKAFSQALNGHVDNGRGRGRGRGQRGGFRGGRGGGPSSFHDSALRGLKIGDFAYAKEGFQLGGSKGNRFVVTLRDVQADSPETIETLAQSIRDHGFINYYGMQRFGMSEIGTHHVGLALLRSDWAGAVDLILKPRAGDPPLAQTAREEWVKTGDANAALKYMPRNLVAERVLLESFDKAGSSSNKAGALRAIPKKLRMMYVHAYQSALWNSVVSERVKRFGKSEPVVGDLVYADDDGDDEPVVEDGDEPVAATEANGAAETTAPAETSGDAKPETDKRASGEFDRLTHLADEPLSTIDRLRQSSRIRAVKVLTEADLPNHTIFDVVLPLPGFASVYPGGQLGEMYRSALTRDGLDPDNLYRPQAEFSMSGAYRKILHKPATLQYRTIRYDDPTFPLAQTDDERIFGRQLPPPAAEGHSLALQIEVDLGSATYVTMMLREFLKTETAGMAQRALTEAMEAQHAARNQPERSSVAAAPAAQIDDAPTATEQTIVTETV